MSYKLQPIKLSGIIKPEYRNDTIDKTESIFWLLTSALGNDVSVQDIGHDFVKDNKKFFLYTQKFGLSLGRHIYGADFSGYIENAVSIKASDVEEILPMLAVLACVPTGISKIEIDDSKLKPYAELIRNMVCSLNVDAEIISDSIYINSIGSLSGGNVQTDGDYRIVLACVLASVFSDFEITITDKEALDEIYPNFWLKLKEYSRERYV